MDVTPGHGVQTERLYPESSPQSELSARRPGLPPRRRLTKSPRPLTDVPFPNPLAIAQRGPDGWTLLVNPDNAAAIAVNSTGAFIWKLANGKRTIAGITAAVRRRYPDAPNTVEADVAAHLATLAEAGLIGQEIPLDSGRGTKN
jgi:hypothetical protein